MTLNNNLLRFYYSVVKRQMFWYFIVSVALTIIVAAAQTVGNDLGSTTISFAQSVLTYMWCFSPLIFIKLKSVSLQILLPASGKEKAAIMILYTFVIVPITLFLVPSIVLTILYNCQGPIGDGTRDLVRLINTLYSNHIIYILSSMLTPAIALLAVVTARKNAILRTIGWVVGFTFISGLIGGVIGVIWAFDNIDMLPNTHITPRMSSAEVVRIMPGFLDLVNALCYISSVMSILTVIVIYLSYRHIVNRQA